MALWLLSVLAVAGASIAAVAPSPPKAIVFILADDLGYNELGYQNASRGLQTPHIDALVQTGAALRQYYTNPLCSPTRSALMTGRYNHRIGLQSNVIYWDTPWGPSLSLKFLPQYMQDAGYKTAMFGKWHLGMHKQAYYPSSRGFEEHVGYFQGCESKWTHVASCCDASSNATDDEAYVCPAAGGKDYRGYDWFNRTTAVPAAAGVSSTDMVASAAESFIARSKDAPFFLYLPFQNIHAPYDCQEASAARFVGLGLSAEQMVMFGYLYELDVAVGRVVAALDAAGIAPEDRVVVFASDNGAPSAKNVEGRNFPLFGFKASTWEGGTRVPAFVSAPGRIPAGSVVTDAMVHVTDWVPTLVALAGGTIAPSADLDGTDVWATLTTGKSVRQEVVVNINPLCNGGQFGAPKAALRMGDLKILCWCMDVAGIDGAKTTHCRPNPAEPAAWPKLFNVTSDVGETTNIAASMPKELAALKARLEVLAGASVEPMQWVAPYQGPSYECASCPLHPASTDPLAPWQAWL